MSDYAWIQKWREMAQVEVDQTRDQLYAEKCNPWEVKGYYSSREQIRLLNVIEDMRNTLKYYSGFDIKIIIGQGLVSGPKEVQEYSFADKASEVLAKYAERPGDEIQ